MIRVYDAINARKSRAEFGKNVEKKRDEIKTITEDKTIQTQLFKEFLARELKKEDIIKAKNNLLELQKEEKANGKGGEERTILKNIVAYSENEEEFIEAENKLLEIQNQREIDSKNGEKRDILKNIKLASSRKIKEGISWDIREYMKQLKDMGYCNFEKEDFEEVTNYFLGEFERALAPIRNIFVSWREEESKIYIDQEKYLRDAMDPDMGQTIISLLSNKELLGLKHALYNFFNKLNSRYSSEFTCNQKELNEIFDTHARKFGELVSFTGDLSTFEWLKNEAGHGNYDYSGYERIKKISIMKGNVRTFFDVDKHNEISSTDLKALSINKEREEQKEKVIRNIYSIIYDINRLSKDMLKTEDFRLGDSDREHGKKAREFKRLTIDEIRIERGKFMTILGELQKKDLGERKEGVSKIIASLLIKGEAEKIQPTE